ncbi:hypothetical protein [Streptomyces hydrogenans]|uniref:hypothetical protein n=1 Tax=Streptomyces hydrogenans TaxID=1873719 RepID=UPI0035DB28F0
MPPALRPLIASCLHKASDSRPSASQLLDLLGAGTPARGDTPPTLPIPDIPEEGTAEPRAPELPVPEPVTAEPVVVSAGLLDKQTWSTINGARLAMFAAGSVPGSFGVLVFTQLSWTAFAATLASGALALGLGAALHNGQPPVRRTIRVTTDHLECLVMQLHWTSPWADIARITLRPQKEGARDVRMWMLNARFHKGAPLPAGFGDKKEREANMAFEFDASEDPRPALRRLDDALCEYAGRRYSPDPDLTAYLDRS